MNNLYEALQVCLEAIERGADIDTVLSRYPDLADELRPILEASRNASSLTVPVPTTEVVRRNRAKVLQRAAQMRESKRSSRRIWFASLRRVAVTLAVVAILFVSGTGLVRAASTTLPGDQLYPVKRTWEDVLVLLTFNSQQREALEVEHENERHLELKELFAEGRSAEVEFAGQVTSQNGNDWVVSGVPVLISAQTEIRDQGIVIGSAVQVEGRTQSNGAVVAEKVELLPPGGQLPDVEEKHEYEGEHDEGDQEMEESSGKGPESEAPKVEVTAVPDSGSEQENTSVEDGSGKSSDSESKDKVEDKSEAGGSKDDDGK
ncbi:MAG TPA: DUF5667 domain-containing protein, partial [Anaerolineales bacterium]|nr:DUF5667 domain-containing protein [Anaerolineales bacterium]